MTTETEFAQRLVRARRNRVTCRAVVSLVAGCAAIAVDRGLPSVILVAPAEHVIFRPHYFVALEARVARVSAQVLVAVLAVGILIRSLLSVIGSELHVVVFGKSRAGQVGSRRVAIDHSLVADLALSDSNALRCSLWILVALGAFLHLRNTYIRNLGGIGHVLMARLAANAGTGAVFNMIPVRENKSLGDHDSSLSNIYFALLMAARTVRHAHDLLGLALMATHARVMTREKWIASLLVARVAIVASNMEAYLRFHCIFVEMVAMRKVRSEDFLAAA